MARILLVDDDRELLNLASALLIFAQFEVTCCLSAIEALDAVQRTEFDVVITDANMSPHSGFDLIRSIKILPDYDRVPIAMLTGRREKRDVERALSVGAEEYIVKPLDPENFLKKVKELVARSEENRRTSRFAEVPMSQVATCEVALLVVGLSETGVLLDSDHALHVGSRLRVQCEMLTRIGVANPQLRVSSCSPGPSKNTFEIRTTFEELDEKQAAKIRQHVQVLASQTKRYHQAS